MTALLPLANRREPAADLHLHSVWSDGLLAPARVVDLAADEGISVIALTDHDTFDGIPEAMLRAGERGVELLTGVEISCDLPGGEERHVLGYGVDVSHGPL